MPTQLLNVTVYNCITLMKKMSGHAVVIVSHSVLVTPQFYFGSRLSRMVGSVELTFSPPIFVFISGSSSPSLLCLSPLLSG